MAGGRCRAGGQNLGTVTGNGCCSRAKTKAYRIFRVSKCLPVAEFRVTLTVITPTKLMGGPTNVLSRSTTGTSQLPDSREVPSDAQYLPAILRW
jgi:hypothetical protein